MAHQTSLPRPRAAIRSANYPRLSAVAVAAALSACGGQVELDGGVGREIGEVHQTGGNAGSSPRNPGAGLISYGGGGAIATTYTTGGQLPVGSAAAGESSVPSAAGTAGTAGTYAIADTAGDGPTAADALP